MAGSRDESAGDFLQVITTTDRLAVMRRIARTCVEQRLAACAQILGPIVSTYHWRGRVTTTREWLCVMKTSRGRYAQLERAIRLAHNYEVPEIIAMPVARLSAGYQDWMDRVLKPGGRTPARGRRPRPGSASG